MGDTIWVDLLRLVGVFILVLANGFFVAAEFSLVSVRRTRIAELVAKGERSAEAVQKAIENPDRVIAATQLGITIASLGLGWLGEPALAHLIYPLVSLFPFNIQDTISHTISAVLAFIIITFLHVVAGELAPKSIALQNPEKTSLFVAKPTLWVERIFKPAIWILNGAGNRLLRLAGVKPASGHELVHSVEELKMLVNASVEGGAVEKSESEMVHAVFDLGALLVRQIMVPRTEIIAVEADIALPKIIQLVKTTNFTKFPVYDDSMDRILGIIHIRDLLTAIQTPGSEQKLARDLLRDVIYVPETTPVTDLLHIFRYNRQHVAIVMDEYGGTAGMVTLEDLLEEIVGEVQDPFEKESNGFLDMPDGSVIIDGLTLIDDVNDRLGLKLNDPDYDTIAGLLLGKLGRIPEIGDDIIVGHIHLRVIDMDGRRISKVSLKLGKAQDAT